MKDPQLVLRGAAYRNLYVPFALLIPATVLAFWQPYYSRLDSPPERVTPVFHVHAGLMILWMLLLVAQAWLVRSGRLRAHRWLGRSSFVLAPLIICFELAVIHAVSNRPPDGLTAWTARTNVFGFCQVLAFTLSWGFAMVYRKRTALHVRFIVSTAFAIAPAVVIRLFSHWVPGFETMHAAALGNGSVLGLGLLALIVADWRAGLKRSPYWVVSIVLGVMHLGFWTFAETDGWYAFCKWFADLPG